MAPAPVVEAKPTIYSKQALLGFSVFFSPVAGGLLAYSSLRAVGQMRAANYVLSLSFFFALFAWLISRSLPFGGAFAVGLGYVWGTWLAQYIQRKLPNAAGYPHRNVLNALGIWVAISVFVFLASRGLRG